MVSANFKGPGTCACVVTPARTAIANRIADENHLFTILRLREDAPPRCIFASKYVQTSDRMKHTRRRDCRGVYPSTSPKGNEIQTLSFAIFGKNPAGQ